MSEWTREMVDAVERRVRGGEGKALPAIIPARARIPKPEMNKTELAFQSYMDLRKKAGDVLWCEFGVWTFKLAKDCRFTPDFPALMKSGEFHIYDTKGRTKNKTTGASTFYAEEDSKIKIRVAAKMYPFFRWFFTFREKSGEWTEVEF